MQVGPWANALWALGRLEEFSAVFAERASLLDRARAAGKRPRQRPYARRGACRPMSDTVLTGSNLSA